MNDSNTAFALGLLWAVESDNRKQKKEELKNEAYQRDPSANPGEYFKRQGWLSFENLEAAYGKGKTTESIRKKYENYLKLKSMKPEDRAGQINNPELLSALNEMSFADIKKCRDEQLTNLVFFKNNSERIAASYGVYLNSNGSVSTDDNAGAKFLGIIFAFFLILGVMLVIGSAK